MSGKMLELLPTEIAIVWSMEDVLEVRPDLTHDQAMEVLEFAEQKHDASIGISWDVLSIWAEQLHPKEEEDVSSAIIF